MKVSVTLILDVDPEAWDLSNGTGTKAADVREDVRTYFTTYAQGCYEAEAGGGIRSIKLKD